MKKFFIGISILLLAIAASIFVSIEIEKAYAADNYNRGECSICRTPYNFDKVVRDKGTDFYFYVCPNCGNTIHLYFPLKN